MNTPLGRSPLVVFLLLGVAVFVVDRWLDDAGAGRVVTVTEEQLGAIHERWAAQWGRPPTGRELEGLIDEAVREEILYREARRRGLDRGDAIIRRRLAQKMTFLLEDSAEAPSTRAATAGDIETYYAAHAERYREPRRTTFRHVFLSTERREAGGDAAALLREVRDGTGDGWRQLGDPFMLLREYADRTDQEIAELFGGAFAGALPALAAGAWQGPLESAHGVHLVLVIGRTGPRRPALDEIRNRVAEDLLESRRRERNEAALRELRERYEIRTPGLSGAGGETRSAADGSSDTAPDRFRALPAAANRDR